MCGRVQRQRFHYLIVLNIGINAHNVDCHVIEKADCSSSALYELSFLSHMHLCSESSSVACGQVESNNEFLILQVRTARCRRLAVAEGKQKHRLNSSQKS